MKEAQQIIKTPQQTNKGKTNNKDRPKQNKAKTNHNKDTATKTRGKQQQLIKD